MKKMTNQSKMNDIFGKINGYFGLFKEIKSEQTLDAAFRREIVTNYIHVLNLDAEAPEERHSDDGGKYHPTGCGDFNMTGGTGRIEADGKRALNGDHCDGSSCVHRKFYKQGSPSINKLGLARNNPRCDVKFEFAHDMETKLKSSRVSLGKCILGILNKNIMFSPEGHKPSINFVPVRTVRDEPSGYRSSGGFINLIYGDKKPLALKIFLNGINFFRFHFFTFLLRQCFSSFSHLLDCRRTHSSEWISRLRNNMAYFSQMSFIGGVSPHFHNPNLNS